MTRTRTRAGGLLPAVAVAALAAGGAAVYAVAPAPPPGAATVGTAATAADARELSGVFRTVAERVMPAVVNVRAEIPARRPNVRRFRRGTVPPGTNGEDLMRDEFFRRFFENDPRFRGFDFDQFEQLQPEGYRNEQNQRRLPGRTNGGSGVVIDGSGLILTNNHVVDGAETVTVQFENGDEYVAAEVLTDPDADIAVLRLDPADLNGKTLPSVPLGDSSRTRIGDWVLAFGSPLGQQFSMTAGIISGTNRVAELSLRENYLQHDAAINSGNSGGPLVNLDGEIVGINTAISSLGGGYDGIAFAVPSNDARWVSDQLVESGEVTRAFLGVQMQPEIDAATADALGLPGDDGVLVTEVVPDSPAEAAGVETGDVIVALAGERVAGPTELRRRVEKLTVGENYPLTVIRDGAETELTLAAGDLAELAPTAAREDRPRRRTLRREAAEGIEVPDYGLALAPLDAAWRDRLGLGETVRGAVVTAVDGPAEAAGLTPGLVVERLGRTDLTGEIDLEAAIDDALARGDQNARDAGLLLLVTDPRGEGRRFVALQPTRE